MRAGTSGNAARSDVRTRTPSRLSLHRRHLIAQSQKYVDAFLAFTTICHLYYAYFLLLANMKERESGVRRLGWDCKAIVGGMNANLCQNKRSYYAWQRSNYHLDVIF